MLITRPEPGASETAARIASLGLSAVKAPLLVLRALEARLPEPERLAAVLVTSAAALPCLPRTHAGLALLAVGEATAAAARRAGWSDIRSADGDATALAALAAASLRRQDGPLLLACGTGQGATLAAALRRHGFSVLRRTVYEARPVKVLPGPAMQALAEGRLRAALFFSAATAAAFAALLQRAGQHAALGDIEAVAIGPPAGQVLARLPWRRVHVASRPTQEAMLAVLQ